MKVFVVLVEDSMECDEMVSYIEAVHSKKEDAQKSLADKKEEILAMYQEKANDFEKDVHISTDEPDDFQVYDEYSDNSSRISISEEDVQD